MLEIGYREDPEYRLLLGFQVILSLYFLLLFYNKPNQAAANVFAVLNALSIGVLYAMRGSNPPLQYSQSIRIGRTIPYITASLAGIYVVAKIAEASFQATLLPIPDIGSIIATRAFSLDLSSSLGGIGGLLDNLAFNSLVASAEETFKVLIINLAAIYVIKERRLSNLFNQIPYFTNIQDKAVWGTGFIVVTIWTGLHVLNAFNSISSIVMAFVSGLILLWLVWRFKNLIPAIIAHTFWNVLISTSPYCVIATAQTKCVQAYSFVQINLIPSAPIQIDIITIGLPTLAILFWWLGGRRI